MLLGQRTQEGLCVAKQAVLNVVHRGLLTTSRIWQSSWSSCTRAGFAHKLIANESQLLALIILPFASVPMSSGKGI